MGGGGGDEDDRLARCDRPATVDDAHGLDAEAFGGGGDVMEALPGQPWMMIKEEMVDRLPFLAHGAAETGEAGNRAGSRRLDGGQFHLRLENCIGETDVDPHLSLPTAAAGNRPGRLDKSIRRQSPSHR